MRELASQLWMEECYSTFQRLKHKLSKAPLLAQPDPLEGAEPYKVLCDAFEVGRGTILVQDRCLIAYENLKRLRGGGGSLQSMESSLAGPFVERACGDEKTRFRTMGRGLNTLVVHAMRAWRCFFRGGEGCGYDHNRLPASKKHS